MKCALAVILLSVLIGLRAHAQCSASCPSADDSVLQAKLAGGGTVELEARSYLICSPVIVPSNTHLKGAGTGSTTLRAVDGFGGKMVSNSYVGSLVGAVGATNVKISDLAVDMFTCGVHANGISLLPTSVGGPSAYDGVVVTDSTVENTKVLGMPGFHSYMVWNLKGRGIKYLNNWIDGNSTSAGAPQEGLKSYGG